MEEISRRVSVSKYSSSLAQLQRELQRIRILKAAGSNQHTSCSTHGVHGTRRVVRDDPGVRGLQRRTHLVRNLCDTFGPVDAPPCSPSGTRGHQYDRNEFSEIGLRCGDGALLTCAKVDEVLRRTR